MSNERIIRAIKGLLFALVIATPLFYWKWSLYPYAVPKTALFEGLVELIFALWIVLAVADRRYRPRMTPLAWGIAAYLGILIITAFTGVDAWRSFFSDLERAYGIVIYIHLAALALVVSSLAREIPWKKLWFASFWASLATVAVALVQLKIPDLLLSNDSVSGRPGSTFGNPTFFAGYLLFNIFLAGYFLLREGRRRQDRGERTEKSSRAGAVFLFTTIVADVAGVFITATRGDILGLFAGIFALLIFFAFQPPQFSESKNLAIFSRRSFYLLLVAILIIAGSGVWFTRTSAIWSHVPGIDRLKDLTLSGSNSDIVPRVLAAGAAWQGFLARPLTGWGFENFNVVFNTYYPPKVLEYGYAESNFDKPHDIVLEMLDAGGALLLLAYLAVLAAGIYQSWKLKDRLLAQFVAAAVVAYFIRSLVIFDTIGPAMMLYLMIGWVDGEYRMQSVESAQVGANLKKAPDGGLRGSHASRPVLAAALIVAAIVIYFLNVTAVEAGYFAWEGHEDIQLTDQAAAGSAAYLSDVGISNIYRWDYVRDFANTIAQAYFYDPTSYATSTVAQAVAEMKQVTIEHPNDAYNHYFLTDIYNLAYTIDPRDYLPAAEQQAQIALKLSPNRQEIFYYLAKTKNLEGDNADALALSKQALDLDPNVADSHFYYGMLAFANGDNTTGYNEVETAVKMGRPWTDYYEPEVAGDYVADAGHLSDAIQLYQDALVLKPNDITTEMKLGAAYYLSGNNALARQYFSDALPHFDFNSSPGYAQYKPILDALGIQP